MIELKPCPFCGGDAHLFVGDGVRVLCVKCSASSKIRVDTMNTVTARGVAGNATLAVIDAWNRRCTNEQS